MLLWKRLAGCSTIPLHLPGHTITTSLSLSRNSGKLTLTGSGQQTWPPALLQSLCPFAGSSPLISWIKMVQEELSEEAQGDGKPQDGRSAGPSVTGAGAA